jgi:tetratricopeptide (TPR) repeat protein
MLEAVLTFYDAFAKQNATNPQLQLEAAKAHRRVVEARLWLGETSKAKISYVRAIELLKTLQQESPDDERSGAELVQTYLTAPPDTEVDEETLVWSLKFTRSLEPGYQPPLLGLVALKLGALLERKGDLAGAETAYREAIGGLSAPEGGNDNRVPPTVTNQAWTRYFLAVLLTNAKRLPDAQIVLKELIDELNRVTEWCGRGSFPQDEVRYFAYEQLAVVCEQMGDRPGVKDAQEQKRQLDDAQERKRQQMPGPGGGPNGRPGGFGGGPPDGPKGPPRKN